MVKKWRSALSVLALVIICSVLLFATDTNAENAIFQAVVDEYLSLELDNTHMEVNVLPTMPFASGYVTATVNTNAAAGYTLSFQDADGRNGLERDGYDEASDKSPFNIPSVSADTTYANLGTDTWGYFLGNTTDTEATYKQIPLAATEIASDDEPVADATAKVNFGVKIDGTRPSGVYEDTLTFSLVASMLPEESLFDAAFSAAGKIKDQATGKYKMQDMTPSICDAVTTPTSLDYSDTPETQLVDTRDGKLYWVAKLMDGKCWMTQNLDFDIKAPAVNVVPLTSENTDLNTFGSNGYDANNGYSQDANNIITWEPERDTIPVTDITVAGSIIGWGDDYDDPYSVDTGDWYWTGVWYNGEDIDTCSSQPWCNYLSGNARGKFFQSSTESGTHGHVGNHYNWAAAIASNDASSYSNYGGSYKDITTSPQNSICPAGWRLPTISNASDTVGSTNEFKRIITLYGNNTSDDRDLTAEPLYFVRSGEVYGGHIAGPGGDLTRSGSEGNYYSSTFYDHRYAYFLYFTASRIAPAANSNRNYGRSIRCVARGGQE